MQPARPSLIGLNRAELEAALAPRPDAKLRAKQIAWHLYRRAESDLSRMMDLPGDLRAELAEQYIVNPLVVAKHQRSTDGVDKLLVHGGDGEVFECVLLPYPDRVSCCLSSQVGCPMGCEFCATGLGGFDRNLTAGEIVSQYLLLQSLSERRISHVVFMGMGEPLLNLENLVKAMAILHDEVGLSYRHLTVSTVGLVPQINQLAELRLPIHLALSLHSPDDTVRSRLMPVNKEAWATSNSSLLFLTESAAKNFASSSGVSTNSRLDIWFFKRSRSYWGTGFWMSASSSLKY